MGSKLMKNKMAGKYVLFMYFILMSLLCLFGYDSPSAQAVGSRQEITVDPKDTNAIRGELATLYCTIANQVGVPSWSKDGDIIAVKPIDDTGDAGEHRWAIFGNESAGEFNLQIVDVDDSDAGVYTCNISQPSLPGGYLSSQPAALHVLPPPEGDFPECLISIEGTLDVGEAVEFTCAYKTESTHQVQLYWTKQDDAAFEPTSPETHIRDGFIVTQFYHSITRDDHLSTFQCIADSSDLPSARSCTTGFIVVRHAPDVMITPAAPSVRRGDSVNFTCLIRSSYPADFVYSWTYKGLPLDSFGEKIIARGTQVSISDIGDDDSDAELTCEAVNDVGSSRATAVIEIVTSSPQSNIYTWVIPIAIIVAIILIILIIVSIVFECRCCCKRYVRTKKLTANGWSAEQFIMETRLHVPERRNSDATTDFFMARDIATPARAPSRVSQQRNQRADMRFIQETAIDNINQTRPDYGSFGIEQRKQQPRNASTSPYQPVGSKMEGYTEVDDPSPERNISPGFSDSGLDYQSSLDGSGSPTSRADSTPIYAQVRRGGRASRIGGSRPSVQERQNIMDQL
ncbi:kin of IRRE-like protein 2 [Lytechinus pictus]|uniref:kin of IRRE-like protein 2 n=1 Tax=Lytechinus pictus TaxID=7653 RepID=UPI0030BA15BC